MAHEPAVKLSVTKRFRFSAAHHLPNYDGPCNRQHGHNFEVEVTVTGRPRPYDGSSTEGMIIEFGEIKEAWERGLKPLLDHHDLNETLAPPRANPCPVPTTELLAQWLLLEFRALGIFATKVLVRETPDNWAEAELSAFNGKANL